MRTAQESVECFCTYVIEVFDKIYSHNLTKRDIKRLYVIHEANHDLPRMIGRLDCMH